jgi:hypothetical protein
MPSSTSSSEGLPASEARRAPPPGLRLTAADRPGVAQPVPERDIPDRPWRAISLTVLIATLLLSGAWEWRMRALALTPGDLDDGPSAWAEQRRRIDAEPVKVAIVGDSRILFDTNLDRFERLTGLRPVQLALPGTNALPFLEDLAADRKFKGVVIVGMAEMMYFRQDIGLMKAALDHGRWESPADRASFQVRRVLARRLAFLADDYRLSNLVARLDPNLRRGVKGPYNDVWKISQSSDERQTWLWPRIENDPRLRAHARAAWDGFKRPVVTKAVITQILARTKAAVAKIRARGGEVVFVRPPDAPPLRVNEEKEIPRARGWDALLAAVPAQGVHFDDLPAAQGLTIPEWSHLNRACAVVFTDAYVRRLAQLTPRIPLRADAPAPLSAADCVRAAPPSTVIAAAR